MSYFKIIQHILCSITNIFIMHFIKANLSLLTSLIIFQFIPWVLMYSYFMPSKFWLLYCYFLLMCWAEVHCWETKTEPVSWTRSQIQLLNILSSKLRKSRERRVHGALFLSLSVLFFSVYFPNFIAISLICDII